MLWYESSSLSLSLEWDFCEWFVLLLSLSLSLSFPPPPPPERRFDLEDFLLLRLMMVRLRGGVRLDAVSWGGCFFSLVLVYVTVFGGAVSFGGASPFVGASLSMDISGDSGDDESLVRGSSGVRLL